MKISVRFTIRSSEIPCLLKKVMPSPTELKPKKSDLAERTIGGEWETNPVKKDGGLRWAWSRDQESSVIDISTTLDCPIFENEDILLAAQEASDVSVIIVVQKSKKNTSFYIDPIWFEKLHCLKASLEVIYES